MELKYKFYYGGDWNPFNKEADAAYEKITTEREIEDPNNEVPLDMIFPTLDSWPDYCIAHSKAIFWEMERAIAHSNDGLAGEIEAIWKDAESRNDIGDWLKQCEASDTEKAMCYYMALQHEKFDPDDFTVDFRLYFTEGSEAKRVNIEDGFSLNPYE